MFKSIRILFLLLIVFLVSAISLQAMAGESEHNKQLLSFKERVCLKNCNTDLQFEQAIRDRLQTGFNNWNLGYAAWLEWCNTLYEPDAHYNVYGQRLTLEQYKAMMGQFFAAFDIKLGTLDNIIVENDWVGIRYTVYITSKQTGVTSELKTMEIVNFKKNPEPIGARVVEGWALSDNPLSTQ